MRGGEVSWSLYLSDQQSYSQLRIEFGKVNIFIIIPLNAILRTPGRLPKKSRALWDRGYPSFSS
jgi:hypothetical protein